MRVRTRSVRGAAAAIAAAALVMAALAGCGAGGGSDGRSARRDGAPDDRTLQDGAPSGREAAREPASAHHPGNRLPDRPAGRPVPAELTRQLPGLGPRTRAEVPKDAGQVVIVTGTGRDSSRSTVVLYERVEADQERHGTARGWGGPGPRWRAGASWIAHNALRGWTDRHYEGDLRSPIGVFGLTDAGGRRKDPGTRLPYDHSKRAFTLHGTGSEGEPLAGSFDYVLAINYNRLAGTSPLDWTRPMGRHRGGGIWFHVDHGGPTQGCVSLSRKNMRNLLVTLDPERNPVVVMGDSASLAR